MRVSTKKYIQRTKSRKNKYSKKVGGDGSTANPLHNKSRLHNNSSNMGNSLLQMFKPDVSVIAENIKKSLGKNNEEASIKAKYLFDKMEELKKQIYRDLEEKKNSTDSYLSTTNQGYGKKQILLKEDMYRTDDSTLSKNERQPDGDLPGIDKVKTFVEQGNMKNLDTPIEEVQKNNYINNSGPNGYRLETLNNEGIKKVEDRLLNCQKLEYHYLRKHDEVVRLFTFILNLFDKYKYQGEILLFLLKYLVKRPGDPPYRPGEPEDKSIRIPRSIITNISKLIKDQESIQNVINTMKPEIMENELDKTNSEYATIKGEISNNPSSNQSNNPSSPSGQGERFVE